MAGHHYWDSPVQVGLHHLARAFAGRGWRVAYVSEPITPLHLLGADRYHLARRWRAYLRGGRRGGDGGIWSCVPGSLVSPQGVWPLSTAWVGRHWQDLTWPALVNRVRREGFAEVDLLLLESLNQPFWLDRLRWRRSAYRLSDNTSGFAGYSPETRKRERRIACAVDAVLYTARSLEGYLAAMSPRRAIYFPNGVELGRFRGERPPRPAEYDDVSGPVAVYVGSIEAWVDVPLLVRAARELPQVTFVLIGPVGAHQTALRDAPVNLRALGPRPYPRLPAYLLWADVGLIPFDVANHPRLVHAVNPLKLYEYLACALPVVCTRWREIEALNSPAALAGSPEEFIAAIPRALETSAGRRAELIDFVRDMDWDRKAGRLVEELGLEGVETACGRCV